MNEIERRLLDGDRRALARALTLVESGGPRAHDIVQALYTLSRPAAVIGITGAPGVGKSTLVDRLARAFAAAGHRVGVLAVDPSSPFSGGALLGDRVRMDDPDPSVFIRSLATRGQVGGLSRATASAITLMEAFGKDRVILETVGAGQSEVDVMGYADTTVVVLVPGMGDDVQANKAGILEIGDLFVVNKADHVGADRVVRDMRSMLRLGPRRTWQPPVLAAVAARGEGIDEVMSAIERHGVHLDESGERARRRRQMAKKRVEAALLGTFLEDLEGRLLGTPGFDVQVDAVAGRSQDPVSAARTLRQQLGWGEHR